MFYFLTVIALFLHADKLIAQHSVCHTPFLRLHTLEYENSSGEKAITTFHYHENGLMDKATWECTDGSCRSNNFYRYNDKKQLTSAYREFTNGLTSYEIFLYNDAGNKTHETFLRSDGVTGTADYYYDKHNQCIRVNCNRYKGWITGDIIYRRKKKNTCVQSADIINKDETIGSIAFEYDEENNLIKDVWTFENGFIQTFLYHYENIDN
ncbi:MAG: hypothetical protein KAT14_01215 [Candidatus Marinimicrobia bacterium]|nr:hypothetical protein [Candidatus Neomarinimicrobiota bacterium]